MFLTAAPPPTLSNQNQSAPAPLELSRTVRPWEFLPVTGTRAALFGDESGTMEAWVYPLKIFREFHLNFLTESRVLPAEALARTLTVRPESATILYAGDTFTVRETFFVPVDAQGAIILLNVETEQPLEIAPNLPTVPMVVANSSWNSQRTPPNLLRTRPSPCSS